MFKREIGNLFYYHSGIRHKGQELAEWAGVHAVHARDLGLIPGTQNFGHRAQ